MADAPAEAAYVLVARLSHIRGMLGVLQTIKQTKKQARAQRRRVALHGAHAAAKAVLTQRAVGARRWRRCRRTSTG